MILLQFRPHRDGIAGLFFFQPRHAQARRIRELARTFAPDYVAGLCRMRTFEVREILDTTS